jgi:hypothetical protein
MTNKLRKLNDGHQVWYYDGDYSQAKALKDLAKGVKDLEMEGFVLSTQVLPFDEHGNGHVLYTAVVVVDSETVSVNKPTVPALPAQPLVEKFEDLNVGDVVLVIESVNGCTTTASGTISDLTGYGEFTLNDHFSLEWDGQQKVYLTAGAK